MSGFESVNIHLCYQWRQNVGQDKDRGLDGNTRLERLCLQPYAPVDMQPGSCLSPAAWRYFLQSSWPRKHGEHQTQTRRQPLWTCLQGRYGIEQHHTRDLQLPSACTGSLFGGHRIIWKVGPCSLLLLNFTDTMIRARRHDVEEVKFKMPPSIQITSQSFVFIIIIIIVIRIGIA